MELARSYIGVGILADVVNNDVPELAVLVVGPVAVKQFVGNVCLQLVVLFQFVAFLVGRAVGIFHIGIHLGSKGNQVVVGREHRALHTQGVMRYLCGLACGNIEPVNLCSSTLCRQVEQALAVVAPEGAVAGAVGSYCLAVHINIVARSLCLQVAAAKSIGQFACSRKYRAVGRFNTIDIFYAECTLLSVGAQTDTKSQGK